MWLLLRILIWLKRSKNSNVIIHSTDSYYSSFSIQAAFLQIRTNKAVFSWQILWLGVLSNQRVEEDNISNVYLIKDLARLTGYSVHTLKFYLKIGLFKEIDRSPETRYRYFDDTSIERLKKIREYRKVGKPIKEIMHELL